MILCRRLRQELQVKKKFKDIQVVTPSRTFNDQGMEREGGKNLLISTHIRASSLKFVIWVHAS